MKRLLVTGPILALLAACSSQADEASPSAPSTSESAVAPAMADASGAAAETTVEGAPNAALAGLAKGDILEATRTTQCRETGASAGEPPWDVATGSFATFVAVEGSDIRVQMAGTECLIPADAVKPSAT